MSGLAIIRLKRNLSVGVGRNKLAPGKQANPDVTVWKLDWWGISREPPFPVKNDETIATSW